MALNLFGVTEAKYYCGAFASTAGVAEGSLRSYVSMNLQGIASLREGTPRFAEYRDCTLRDAERCLFLAISHYRRAFDFMMPSSCAWAHVTLYYSCFYSATALLAMFGAAITDRALIDVFINAPGSQELRIDRVTKSVYQGSHRRFWDFFYGAVAPLHPWVDPALAFAMQPLNGGVTWLIDNRNSINYDTHSAWQLMTRFQAAFRRSRFRSSLPGELSTQFTVSEALLLITCSFAVQFGLNTDALSGLVPGVPRSVRIRRLVFQQGVPVFARGIRRLGIVV